MGAGPAAPAGDGRPTLTRGTRGTWGRPPLLRLLRTYRRADLAADVTAGATTAVMLVPQAMAYALVAGLPPIVGLYASTVPLVVYALFGTSRQLGVGPAALDALLIGAGLAAFAPPQTSGYVALAATLALMVGAIQMLMAALRAGFLVNFLSQPVVSGFTSAAALVIAGSQLGHLLGVPLDAPHQLHTALGQLASDLPGSHLPTAALGVGSVALLLVAKRRWPRLPGALLAVALGTLVTWALDLGAHGVRTVGHVPGGLPPLSLPPLDLPTLQALAPLAATLALVGTMEVISVGKVFARKHRYDIDPDQELLAIGAANATGGLLSGHPIATSFSRTAVNASAGARTTVATLATAALVTVTLLALTPLFRHLPLAALAALIVVACVGLVEHREARRLWTVKRSDFALLAFTFAATLTLGVDRGLLVGVAASLVLFLVRTTRPHFAVLGRLPGAADVYRNVRRFPEAVPPPGVLVLRVDAQFYFGNVTFLKDTLRRLTVADATLHAVVLDASGMNQLDSSAEAALRDLEGELADRGVTLHLAEVKGPVRDVLQRSGLWQHLGPGRIHWRVHDAVLAATPPFALAV